MTVTETAYQEWLRMWSAPVKAMIGPWIKDYPHDAALKPQVEWRHEAVRWFDQFLKQKNTGILDEPKFAIYMRDYQEPDVIQLNTFLGIGDGRMSTTQKH